MINVKAIWNIQVVIYYLRYKIAGSFGEIIKRSIRDIYMTLNHGKVFLIRVYPIENTHTK